MNDADMTKLCDVKPESNGHVALPLTEGEQRTAEEITEKLKLRIYALRIHNNKQLRKVLMDADPAMRKQVYELLRPLLKFKPTPYIVLMH